MDGVNEFHDVQVTKPSATLDGRDIDRPDVFRLCYFKVRQQVRGDLVSDMPNGRYALVVDAVEPQLYGLAYCNDSGRMENQRSLKRSRTLWQPHARLSRWTVSMSFIQVQVTWLSRRWLTVNRCPVHLVRLALRSFWKIV